MSILAMLEDYNHERGRIVSFGISMDKKSIIVREECDGYFFAPLTKAEFGEMIAELQALHTQMTD